MFAPEDKKTMSMAYLAFELPIARSLSREFRANVMRWGSGDADGGNDNNDGG